MYNIDLMNYGRFTKEMHQAFNRAHTYEELDEIKRGQVMRLKFYTRKGRFNADEYTRLRFRISGEYISRIATCVPGCIYFDTDSVKVGE